MLKYCIRHGREVWVGIVYPEAHIIEKVLMIDGPSEFDVCYGPFASCPPPAILASELETLADEGCPLSIDELEASNQAALELLEQFIS